MTRKLSTVSKMNQNHRKMYTFSLTIFKGNKQSASCFSTSPDVPNLWNVHLVILGNTYIKGSNRSSWSCSANAITSKPNVRNAPSKKRSIRNIWPGRKKEMLIVRRIHKFELSKYWLKSFLKSFVNWFTKIYRFYLLDYIYNFIQKILIDCSS